MVDVLFCFILFSRGHIPLRLAYLLFLLCGNYFIPIFLAVLAYTVSSHTATPVACMGVLIFYVSPPEQKTAFLFSWCSEASHGIFCLHSSPPPPNLAEVREILVL